ncbi:MAG TPA: HAMP domain-containing sensor histidine kinase [Steroidobacteraceae bacterium]|nr:HAMP domain-containing sensor histidine kinase [Steroidobacteraceae bacterium]
MDRTAPNFSGPEAILSQVIDITRGVALAEMASGIAHELNQPLGAIATFAQAGTRMLDRPQPMVSRALEVFEQINQEALNAGEGIRRIRRLFNQEDMKPARCYMHDLIAELEPALHLLSKRCDGRLELDFGPTSAAPALNIDRAKIQHVLFSLVQNGFESAPGSPSKPLVRVMVNHDRYTVETSVMDSGPGVPADAQQRLFKPFYTTKSRGTGLGLASSHSILEAHQGAIGFENLASGGCRFWFRLPHSGA